MRRLKQRTGLLLAMIMTLTLCAWSGIIAVSEEATYNVRIFTTINGYGTTTDIGGTVNGAGDYKAGDTVTLTASPNQGYCSAGWIENNGLIKFPATSSIQVTFTMPTGDVQITVTFKKPLYLYEDVGDGTHREKCFNCGDTKPAEKHADTDGDELCDKCNFDFHVHTLVDDWNHDSELHWRGCSTCGHEYAEYGEHDYKIIKCDTASHWYECVCGLAKDAEKENHKGGTATCTQKAKCSVCGTAYGTALSHVYGSKLYSDKNGHWKQCACGAKSTVDAHVSSGAATEDKAETCTVCGYVISPKLSHTHAYVAIPGNDGHILSCQTCGEKTDKEPHSGNPCTVCGFEIPVLYRITFDVYPDKTGDENEVTHGGGIVSIPGSFVPTEQTYTEGGSTYRFVGWRNEEGQMVETVDITEDTVFYGVWIKQQYVIIVLELDGGVFENGGKYIISAVSPKLDSLIEYCNEKYVPTKEGKEFDTWAIYGDGASVDEYGYLVPDFAENSDGFAEGCIILKAQYRVQEG